MCCTTLGKSVVSMVISLNDIARLVTWYVKLSIALVSILGYVCIIYVCSNNLYYRITLHLNYSIEYYDK